MHIGLFYRTTIVLLGILDYNPQVNILSFEVLPQLWASFRFFTAPAVAPALHVRGTSAMILCTPGPWGVPKEAAWPIHQSACIGHHSFEGRW